MLTRGLQLVAINLTVERELAGDLRDAEREGHAAHGGGPHPELRLPAAWPPRARTHSAHLDDWPFETEFWEKEVSVGRYPMQRSSLFFNQWLIARVGEEVSPRATFTRFKQYVEHVDLENGQKVADLLPLIRKQAETYEAWTKLRHRWRPAAQPG